MGGRVLGDWVAGWKQGGLIGIARMGWVFLRAGAEEEQRVLVREMRVGWKGTQKESGKAEWGDGDEANKADAAQEGSTKSRQVPGRSFLVDIVDETRPLQPRQPDGLGLDRGLPSVRLSPKLKLLFASYLLSHLLTDCLPVTPQYHHVQIYMYIYIYTHILFLFTVIFKDKYIKDLETKCRQWQVCRGFKWDINR